MVGMRSRMERGMEYVRGDRWGGGEVCEGR